MGAYKLKSFVFTALDDFRANTNPEQQLDAAQEFGIRIIHDNGLQKSDYKVISGPFWRFRLHADRLIKGVDDDCSFFIRKVEATTNSSTKLYYYDLKTGKEAIIAIKRRPGLHLSFCSGRHRGLFLVVDMMCSEENHLCFLSFGDRFDIE